MEHGSAKMEEKSLIVLDKFFLSIFSPFSPHTARRNPCFIPSFPIFHSCYGMTEEQHHSFGFTQSRDSFPSAFGLSLTSLPAQNRLQSLNTSISE